MKGSTKGAVTRILHLLSQRPDSTGSGTYVAAMLREARARGHENYLVAALESADSRTNTDLAAVACAFLRFSGSDISFPIVGMSDVMPYPSRTFASLSAVELDEYERAFTQVLTQAVAAQQPDVIHTHHLWLMTALARRLFPRIPMVASCHGSDLRQFQRCAHLRARVSRECRGLDAILAESQAQRAEIIERYSVPPERVTVVGGGYDTGLFLQVPKPKPDPVRIVYVGKLSAAKGVPSLLRGLRQLHGPRWELHVVGGGAGAEAAECLALAGQLSAVQVHGALSQRDVASMMQLAHVLVLPSLYEGLPLVLIEGLAAGCRLVSTDLPGVREVLGPAGGNFIRLVRPPELHAIDQMVPESAPAFESRLREAIQEQIEVACDRPDVDLAPVSDLLSKYSWSGVFSRVAEVYRSVSAT